jgi:hypothetical protein
LFDVRENGISPGAGLLKGRLRGIADSPIPGAGNIILGVDIRHRSIDGLDQLALVPTAIARQDAVRLVVLEDGDADLTEVVGTADAAGCLPDSLDRDHEQRGQNGNNPDDHEQLQQSETRAAMRIGHVHDIPPRYV